MNLAHSSFSLHFNTQKTTLCENPNKLHGCNGKNIHNPFPAGVVAGTSTFWSSCLKAWAPQNSRRPVWCAAQPETRHWQANQTASHACWCWRRQRCLTWLALFFIYRATQRLRAFGSVSVVHCFGLSTNTAQTMRRALANMRVTKPTSRGSVTKNTCKTPILSHTNMPPFHA